MAKKREVRPNSNAPARSAPIIEPRPASTTRRETETAGEPASHDSWVDAGTSPPLIFAKENGYLVWDDTFHNDCRSDWFNWCEENQRPYVILHVPTGKYTVIRCEWDLIAHSQGIPDEIKHLVYGANRLDFFRIAEDFAPAHPETLRFGRNATVTNQGNTYAVITDIRPEDAHAVAARMVEIAGRNLFGLLTWRGAQEVEQ